RVDGHADHADLALGARMIRIEPELRRQIEGDVERVLAVGHEVLEARVRLPGRAEADVLAHGPEPLAIHVAMDAARVGILSGPADVPLAVAHGRILGAIHRLHRDARMQSHVLHHTVSLNALSLNAATIAGSGVPIGKTRFTPSANSAATSRGGMMPPTTTATSVAF